MAPAIGADASTGISGQALRTGEIQRCDDTANDQRVNAEVCQRMGVRSLVVVPIHFGQRTAGVVTAFFAVPNGFDDRTVGELEKLAGLLGQIPLEPPSEVAEVVAPLWDPEPKPPRPLSITLMVVAATLLLIAAGVAVYRLSGTGYRAGTPKPQPTSPPATSDPLLVSAEEGNALAQYHLAQRYFNGDGVAPDQNAGMQWLQRSAEAGNTDAQNVLASAYATGLGVEKDTVQAAAWYIISAANGNDAAAGLAGDLTSKMSASELARTRYLVGTMFAGGDGIAVDRVSAYVWFKLADLAGSRDGRQALSIVSKLMTPDQVRAADQRATDWIATHRSAAAQSQSRTPPR